MSELEYLIPRVIEELQKSQDYYVILSDSDYVRSEFFNSNRKHLGKEEWIHCVDPATKISVVEIFFKNSEIVIPLSKKEIKGFQTEIDVEQKIMKPGSKNQYISLRLKRNGEMEYIDDTVALAGELFKYARRHHQAF